MKNWCDLYMRSTRKKVCFTAVKSLVSPLVVAVGHEVGLDELVHRVVFEVVEAPRVQKLNDAAHAPGGFDQELDW